jgi:hypothetical protein
MTAMVAVVCSALSTELTPEYKPRRRDAITRCAVELMGMNSVSPWTIPRMIACKIVMKIQKFCDFEILNLKSVTRSLVFGLWSLAFDLVSKTGPGPGFAKSNDPKPKTKARLIP